MGQRGWNTQPDGGLSGLGTSPARIVGRRLASTTGSGIGRLPQVERVRERFGIEQLVLVGDRGMISQTQITVLKTLAGVAWMPACSPFPFGG